MVTEETLKTHEMELESRIRNLVWTVSGDYTLKLNPDVERYAKEPDTVLYDTIRQGAFSCYFDREAYSLYLVKKVYSGAAEGELMMLAQLVTEEAVSKRLESERPGVKGFRRRAAEEILDHSFESLSKNETGRLKLEYLRGRREEDEEKSPSYSGKTREWMELLKHASETADTMELIRVTDELYNKVVDPAFVKKHGDLASVLAVTIEELTEYSWKDFLSEELYEDGLETYLERVSLDMTNFTSKEAEEKKEKTAGSDTKKVVVVDEKALARMYQYIQRNYGKTWLSESEEKSRNYQLCRGIHSDCSLYYTEGVLKNPVGKYYQLSYAQKQKDKNLHAYYDQHRAVPAEHFAAVSGTEKSDAAAGGPVVCRCRPRNFTARADVEGGTESECGSVPAGAAAEFAGFCRGYSRGCERFPAAAPGECDTADVHSGGDLKPPAHPVPRDELLYVLGLHDSAPDARLRRSAGEEQQYF